MGKSYEDYALGLFEALFNDIAQWDHRLRSDCVRDYNRILSGVEQMGIGFVVDTLPAFGKIFDKSLSEERLVPSRLPHFRAFKRGSAIPRLFKGLLLRVFNIDGSLLPKPDVQAIRYLRQCFRIGKDLRLACPDSRTYENVQEFFRTDSEIRNPTLDWFGPNLRSSSSGTIQCRDLALYDLLDQSNREHVPGETFKRISISGIDIFGELQRAADIVSATLGRFDPHEWRSRHGPGAVADLKGQDINKYTFPVWSSRLDNVFPMADFAFANWSMWADAVRHEAWCEHSFVDANPSAHLLAVPKTYRGPRLIAAEPVSHQWCQQMVRDYFMTRVQETPIRDCIRFADQSYNGTLALEASHSGSHGTIDLSSASDRISCWLVERFFRHNETLLDALHACRTQWIRQDLDLKAPKYAKLQKFSTMGSAVTFPIQSIIFSTIAATATLLSSGRSVSIKNLWSLGGRVRVFGDDIIVPEYAMELTQDLLHSLGLRVNTSKTHGTGKFRESCGVDAYDGHDVTAVGIRRVPARTKPESVVSAIDCHNNLILKGLWNTAQYIRETVSRFRGYSIPEVCSDSGVLGWLTIGKECDNTHLKDRWNPSLHQREFRVSSLRGPSERVQSNTGIEMLQYYTEEPWRSDVSSERLGTLRSQRKAKLSLSWVPSYLAIG